MPLQKFQFKPGVNREVTPYTNEGGWVDCNHIRFRFGFPEKIGGWRKLLNGTFLGTCRSLFPWVTLSSESLIGVGTNRRLYYQYASTFYNITPIRATTSAGDITFADVSSTLSAGISASQVTIALADASSFPTSGFVKIDSEEIQYNGVISNTLQGCTRGVNGTTPATHTGSTAVFSSAVLVTDASHGADNGAFVTFSGAASLGGNITAPVLNTEHEITSVLTANTYFIVLSVYANASDSGDGGASTVGVYEINPGPDSAVFGAGWGAGAWSRGAWNSAASVSVEGSALRIWSQDQFGEDLLANIRDGKIYYWDRSATANIRDPERAVELSSLPGSNLAPTIAKQIMVSDQSRHVIAFGCDPESDIGTQDPMVIRFSDQESLTEWQSLPTNSAGELRIGTGSEIVAAVETRQQILVFTDASLHAMQYLGAPFTFGIQELAYNTTIQGPNAVVTVNDVVYWMGRSNFYAFTGRVEKIPCTVRDYVFSDINDSQRSKVFAGVNSAFSEVFWFYPSSGSSQNDRYVVFNYEEGVWYYGQLSRSAWVDRGVLRNPVASANNYLYEHEVGMDADGSPMSSYIESSPVDLADGNNYMLISRILPDVSFRNSTATSPVLDLSLTTQNAMGGAIAQSTTNAVTQTATIPIQQYTDQIQVRLRGRSMQFKISSSELGVQWRLGSPLIDLRPDGRR